MNIEPPKHNSSSINVLAITWIPPTSSGEGYGGFTRFLRILRTCKKLNVKFYILSYGSKAEAHDNRNYWISTWHLPNFLSSSYIARTFFSIFFFFTIIIKGLQLRHIVNCVYTPNAEISSACLAAYTLSIIIKKPLILSFQLPPGGAFGLCGETYKLYRSQGLGILSSIFMELYALASRCLALHAAKHARVIIVPSKTLAKQLLILGMRGCLLKIIPNPVFSYHPEGIKPFYMRPPLAVFIGRQVPQKGVLDLIKAWKLVIKHLPSAKLIIVGYCTREMEKLLLKEMKRAGIEDSVIKVGLISRPLLERILRLSKVMVLPSRLESQCLTINEALSYGCYVVCYDIPAIEEFYNTEYVKRVPVGDIVSLAEEIAHLLKNTQRRKFLIPHSGVLSSWDKTAFEEIRLIVKFSG